MSAHFRADHQYRCWRRGHVHGLSDNTAETIALKFTGGGFTSADLRHDRRQPGGGQPVGHSPSSRQPPPRPGWRSPPSRWSRKKTCTATSKRATTAPWSPRRSAAALARCRGHNRHRGGRRGHFHRPGRQHGRDDHARLLRQRLASVPTSSIVVRPAEPSQLVIQTQPSPQALLDQPLGTQPVIYEEDQYGNLETNDNNAVVTAALNSGVGPFQGKTTAKVVGGVATFAGLADDSVESMTLKFTSGSLTPAVSNTVVVSPAVDLTVNSFTAAPGSDRGRIQPHVHGRCHQPGAVSGHVRDLDQFPRRHRQLCLGCQQSGNSRSPGVRGRGQPGHAGRGSLGHGDIRGHAECGRHAHRLGQRDREPRPISTRPTTRPPCRPTCVDRVGTIEFSAAEYAVPDNAGSAAITVSRVNGARGTVTVDYKTVPINATPGLDYTPVSGTLTFPNGVTSETIVVPVLDDPYDKHNELVSLVLSNVQTTETLGQPILGTPSTATLTIQDIDPDFNPLVVNNVQWTGTAQSITQIFVTFNKPLITVHGNQSRELCAGQRRARRQVRHARRLGCCDERGFVPIVDLDRGPDPGPAAARQPVLPPLDQQRYPGRGQGPGR